MPHQPEGSQMRKYIPRQPTEDELIQAMEAEIVSSFQCAETAKLLKSFRGQIAGLTAELQAARAERDRLREALLGLNREFPEDQSGKPPCWCVWTRDIRMIGHSPACLDATVALSPNPE